MTAVTKCYPGKGSNGKGDRLPGKRNRSFAAHISIAKSVLYKPRLIIPVGGLAIKLFYPASLKAQPDNRHGLFIAGLRSGHPLKYDLKEGRAARRI